ncbi:MAG: NAD-dependent epimerase/dehydratase family protein [Methylobacteriaceae bacterium]|nr:NAD-dependent epimerase/dehydratase family protein [Methylobacteriaceae bacterium]
MTQAIDRTARRRLALVIGATGTIGSAAAAALKTHGWAVRALTRDPGRISGGPAGIDWVKGDAMVARDVVRAAEGVTLIVHAANPPGYRNWRGLAIPMLQASIAAARASGARLVLPGTVYNFGADAGPVITEASPQHPTTRKGAVRVEMERLLAEAARTGVRSLIVRAGDFFGPHAKNSWFTQGLVRGSRPLQSIPYPGPRHVGHTWAYVPDLAETITRLAEIEADLPDHEMFNFGGHWMEPGVEMAHAVRRALGAPELPIRGFPWYAVYLAAPFVTMMREMIEMRYLWKVPLRLDNRKLVSVLGTEPHTPLDQAVRASLQSLGHLEPTAVERERTLTAL